MFFPSRLYVEVKLTKTLEYLLKSTDNIRNHAKLLNLHLGISSLMTIFDHLQLVDTNRLAFKHAFTLSEYNLQNYLSLDRAAFVSLNILTPKHSSEL